MTMKYFHGNIEYFAMIVNLISLTFRHIKRVGLNLEVPGGTRVIDATGKLILPGTLTLEDILLLILII